MVDEVTSVCGVCGASVYKEHLDAGIARYEDGKLLCTHCVVEYEQMHDSAGGAVDEELAPITFDSDDDKNEPPVDMSESRIQVLTGTTVSGGGPWDESRFKRRLDPKSGGASRCRMFHSKLSDGAVDFMTNSINEWLDANKDIVIKFATSTIGPFEGKHTEPNLILTLYY